MISINMTYGIWIKQECRVKRLQIHTPEKTTKLHTPWILEQRYVSTTPGSAKVATSARADTVVATITIPLRAAEGWGLHHKQLHPCLSQNSDKHRFALLQKGEDKKRADFAFLRRRQQDPLGKQSTSYEIQLEQ